MIQVKEKFKGLSDNEVELYRKQFGINAVKVIKENRLLQTLKDIIKEPLFIILVLSAFVYFIVGELNEGIIMLVSICFVAGISLYQENRSKNAVDALKKLSAPLSKVIRNGEIIEISSEEIVIHDVISVEDGNLIPADAMVLEAHDFSVSESILTGESLPVVKDSTNNKLFQGTLVMTGSCIAEITAIGAQTELGKIGKSLEEIEISKTPLQLQISSFVRSMVGAGAIAFFIVWGINYYTSGSILHGLLHGLTLAMSVLPEEIPVAFSTFMALGAYHLYKKNVIARNPLVVETLGSSTVICVDKTGTITENEMKLAIIYDYAQNKFINYTSGDLNFTPVLEIAMWASETEPFDPMEKAIHALYSEVFDTDKRPDFTLRHEYPLGGMPPIMTHVFSDNKNNSVIAVKGSVEGVLKQSKLSGEIKEEIQSKAIDLALKGYRVLAVAQSNHDIKNLPETQFELEFIFLGLLAFYDPPKSNMKEIIKSFYNAGINVKMITGDFAETAISIAGQIELRKSNIVLTGNEVMNLNEQQLCEKVNEINIYARMFPEAKLKVIEALKANGEVVAMTGDGVNDGPALKAAHIGIAMGLRGSEIAKKVASLILMDDDLSNMVNAVELGRRIYENLKKAIQYIISIHIPIILIVTVPLLLFWKFTDFFSPIHVIFLELIMGPTCSIIFENEPIEENSMKKSPRKMVNTFFSFRELSLSIIQGVVITVACLGIGYFYMMKGSDESVVRTVIYTTLIFSNLFLTLVNRSFYYSVFTTIRYKNRLIPLIIIISLIVLFLSVYVHPVRNLFLFTEIGAKDLIQCLAIAFIGVMWVELLKFVRRLNGNNPQKS